MLRAIEDVAHRPLLDHAAGVHHHDPVAESGNDAEVVGDHDDGGAEIALQVGQQIEDLRLDGDVEGGGRSEEHTSELQSLMRISYAVFCLKKKNNTYLTNYTTNTVNHYT